MFGFISKSHLVGQIEAVINLIREIHEVLLSHKDEIATLRNDLSVLTDTTHGIKNNVELQNRLQRELEKADFTNHLKLASGVKKLRAKPVKSIKIKRK